MHLTNWQDFLKFLQPRFPTLAVRQARRRLRGSTAAVEALELRVLPTVNVVFMDASTPPFSNSVTYTVVFDDDVKGVDATDFQVVTCGSVTFNPTTIEVVSADPTLVDDTTYLVTIHGISGTGDLRLDLIDDDSISDELLVPPNNVPLGGLGLFNGSFQGETYHVLATRPKVLTIERIPPPGDPSYATNVNFRVTFSEPVQGVNADDFLLVTSGGLTVGDPIGVSGSAGVYTVSITGISGNGTLGLNLVDNDTIHDFDGNPLTGLDTNVAFGPPQTVNVGGSAKSIATGDLNGDTLVDLVAVNSSSGFLSVKLGNGDGTFQPPQLYPIAGSPGAVAVRDLDGDGKPDVVVLNRSTNTFDIFIGNGDGSLQAPQELSAGVNPSALVIETANLNGYPDLLITNEADDNALVLLNFGGGVYTPAPFLNTGTAPAAIVMGDVNRDGFLDVVVANKGANTVNVFLSQAGNGFGPALTFGVGDSPSGVALGDIDRDGNLDIVTANKGSDNISVLRGNGNGTFQIQTSRPTGGAPLSVMITDVNGDGRVDVIVTNSADDTIGVLLGNASGGLLPQQVFPTGGAGPEGLAIADVDRDGRLDVLTAHEGGVTLLRNALRGDLVGQVFNRSNSAPVINSPGSVNVPENTAANSIVYQISFTDVDAPTQAMTYSITGPDASKFVLNAATGEIRILAAPDYEQPTDQNFDNVYLIKVSVDDGFGGFDSRDVTINIQPLNDNPPQIISGSGAFQENTPTSIVLLEVQATDADQPSQIITYSLTGTDAGDFTFDTATGFLSFLNIPDFEQPADDDANNVYNLVVTASDGILVDVRNITITVTAINDNPPTIGSPNTASIPENSPASAVVLNVVAIDADVPPQNVTFSLSGDDSALFNINSSGELRFNSSPDFEASADQNHDNVYEILITPNDGFSDGPAQAVTITVLPVNDNAPVISSSNAANVFEDTPPTTVVLEVNATDADLPTQTLSYNLTGTDAGRFSIDTGTGEIRFLVSPDFEAPVDNNGDNLYELIVTVSDGVGGNKVQNITVAVQPLNESLPVISSAPTANVDENTPASIVVLDVNATDADLPPQTLSYAITGPDAALFGINLSGGQIRFLVSPDYESPADQGQDNTYELTVIVTDGNGGSQTQDLTINVQPVDDNLPAITSLNTASINENSTPSTVVLNVDATDADQPFLTPTYALSGDDVGRFSIDSETGEIRFLVSPDFEVPSDQGSNNLYQITVTATSNGQFVTQDLTISVLPVNDNAPVISSPDTATFAENTSTAVVVLDVNATDADLPTEALIYSLLGTDSLLFTINSSNGAIRFISSPDFESPSDLNLDHVYELSVQVSDGGGGVQTQPLLITVLPVNDNTPAITSANTANFQENTSVLTVVLDVNATDADLPGQSFTYDLAGADAELFSISNTGEIRFLNSPNFESPTDIDGNNSYALTVIVTDSVSPNLSITQAVTINVTNQNESPLATSRTVQVTENTAINDQVTGSDPDAGTVLNFSLVGLPPQHGSFSFNPDGTFDYTPDPGFIGSDGFDFIANDGTLNSNIATVSLSVNSSNSPPVAQSATQTIPENLPNGTPVWTVIAIDPDNIDTPGTDVLNYFITGGNTNSAFSIDLLSGEIRVSNKNALNYEVLQQIDLEVTVTDTAGQSSVATITFVITNVNEPLLIGLPLSPSTYVKNGPPVAIDPDASVYDEDLTRTDYYRGRLVVTISMSDPSKPTDPNDRLGIQVNGTGPGKISLVSRYIVYGSPLNVIGTIVSGLDDGGPLVIDLTTFAGDLTSVPALLKAITFYNISGSPRPGNRTITFDLHDRDTANTGTQTKEVLFDTDSADPVITRQVGDLNVTLGARPAQMFSAWELTDADSPNLNGGRLTVQAVEGGNSGDRLSILRMGGIRVSGRDILFGKEKIGRLTFGTNSLTVDFTTKAASPAAVQALLRAIAFSTTRDQNGVGTRLYEVNLSDGGGGHAMSATKLVHVSAPLPHRRSR